MFTFLSVLQIFILTGAVCPHLINNLTYQPTNPTGFGDILLIPILHFSKKL